MKRKFISFPFFTLLCLSLISGCSRKPESDEALSSFELQRPSIDEPVHSGEADTALNTPAYSNETDITPDCPVPPDTSVQESTNTEDVTITENPTIEIYAGGDAISIPPDQMTASVPLNEILRGTPILYNRFEADNKIFEWLISDYTNMDNYFVEDAVLLISSQEETQILHAEAEGGYGHWVSAEKKFLFTDVNFDGLSDLLICSGHHGAQGAVSYYCFLQTNEGFHEAPSFTDIPNPAIDTKNKLILSQWRNSASSHSWAEYAYENNCYVLKRELREQAAAETEDEQTVWIWTVNDVEIGRSSQLSDEEIENLLYNENSEWQIASDRWRTLYNDGLTVDYSIYSEP